MSTSSRVTALFLQKIPSAAGLQPCLAYRWAQKKQEETQVSSKFCRRAWCEGFLFGFETNIISGGKGSFALGRDYSHTHVVVLLSQKASLLPGSQAGQAVMLQPSHPMQGVRRQQSDAVCILSRVAQPMGDSRLPSCFSTGPRDLVALFQ